MRCSSDPWRPGARAVSLGAVLALFAFATSVRAGDLEERAQDVVDALRGGDVARAADLLGDDTVAAALASRPDLVHVLCDRAYRCDEALRAAPAGARRGLSGSLLEIAESAHAGAPDDTRGCWALAHALVLRERSGPPQGADAWLRAADLLESAHARTPGAGEALGYAVTFLLEGAVLEPDDQHGLIKRAAALSREAQREHEGADRLALTLASSHLWAARTLLPDNRKTAKAALQTVFSQLERFAEADLPHREVAALWNDAVTLDAEARFALRKRYVTAPASALGGALVFDVPVAPRWTVTRVPATAESAAYVYVTQTDASGAPLRQLLFRSYTWGYGYTFTGPNEVKGDNVKNLARGLRDLSAERVFAPGPEVGDVRKDRVGRDLVGQSFRVSGREAGEEGGPLTLHGWCVRGGHQASYGVLVYVYAEDGGLDAEMLSVLESLHEPRD